MRKTPEERRSEIVAEAARLALGDGLERITLRAVATELGVRPGLIHHYFPVAEDLVIAAFEQAISAEREWLFGTSGDAITRLVGFVRRVGSPDADEQAKLWLNARHLAKFMPRLSDAILAQESLDRDRLLALIQQGKAEGVFTVTDDVEACIRIFMAVDGYGAYANTVPADTYLAFTTFVRDVCEWALGLTPGTLQAATSTDDPATSAPE